VWNYFGCGWLENTSHHSTNIHSLYSWNLFSTALLTDYFFCRECAEELAVPLSKMVGQDSDSSLNFIRFTCAFAHAPVDLVARGSCDERMLEETFTYPFQDVLVPITAGNAWFIFEHDDAGACNSQTGLVKDGIDAKTSNFINWALVMFGPCYPNSRCGFEDVSVSSYPVECDSTLCDTRKGGCCAPFGAKGSCVDGAEQIFDGRSCTPFNDRGVFSCLQNATIHTDCSDTQYTGTPTYPTLQKSIDQLTNGGE